MKLTVFNGSSKTGINNTEMLVKKFAEGFIENNENQYISYKLNKFKNLDEAVNIYEDSEYVIFAFPLYNYSMPAIIKEFVEKLEPISQKKTGKKIGFMVHSGFPEAIHSRPLEKYLENLTELLKCNYLGTIIKGGCSLITKKPGMYKKTFISIYKIGKQFGNTGYLDKEMLIRFAKPEKLIFIPKFILKFIAIFIMNKLWHPDLKKNGVFENRFAKPYQNLNK